MSFFLKGHDNPQTVSLGDLWHPESLLSFIGTYILVAIVVAIGLILFVIPGIILALMLMFALWFVIDRGLGPIEAMKASNEITRGHKWQLLGFLIVLWLINLVGALALGIGLLVTVPVTVLSIIEAYRRLGG
ncbi:hypothetical protein V6C03_12855 [Methyloligella sp. 2.7D]|uniref:hypothetical protein n=1 Tax=unclassified Methyloligella TaxID=2625955 RepID=UPI00157DFABC|nr:hypothetical protein [Methyloligella sp. GL2]QKP77329.1 hypothetical protein HT051_07605 [Methyloligella sp. GL2]